MRSAQFGCNDLARDALRDSSIPSFKIGGVVESHIVLAGMCGGLGRAVVEGPTEFFKIRQQIVAHCVEIRTSTPSSRRSYGDKIASTAWGA